jgi:hypothetical protein
VLWPFAKVCHPLAPARNACGGNDIRRRSLYGRSGKLASAAAADGGNAPRKSEIRSISDAAERYILISNF